MKNVTTESARLETIRVAKSALRAMRGSLGPNAMATRRLLLAIASTGLDLGMPEWAWRCAGYSKRPWDVYKTYR